LSRICFALYCQAIAGFWSQSIPVKDSRQEEKTLILQTFRVVIYIADFGCIPSLPGRQPDPFMFNGKQPALAR
jgi:hypothetical protein